MCVCVCAAICGHRSLCSQLLSCTRICHHHSWPCWSCTHLLCACLCGSHDGEVTTCKTQGQDQLTNSRPLCHPKRETDDHRPHYCCVYIPLCRQFQAQERHFMSPRQLSAGKPCSCNCHLFSGIDSAATATTHSGCTSEEKFSTVICFLPSPTFFHSLLPLSQSSGSVKPWTYENLYDQWRISHCQEKGTPGICEQTFF